MIMGAVMVMLSGFGFWFVLRSVDHRQEYLAAARYINRWDPVVPSDFKTVLADLGEASGVTPDQQGTLVGKIAAGVIPAGTIVTGGMFRDLPLSGEGESDKVLIDVVLPANDAAFGTLETGDTVALLGREAGNPNVSLIGVLTLDFVQGGTLYYLVTPTRAIEIEQMVERYNSAGNRRLWKMGSDLAFDDIAGILGSTTPDEFESFDVEFDGVGTVEK